jgi:C4-dicarboxylate transporter, DctM subunit
VSWEIEIVVIFAAIAALLASGLWIPFAIGLTAIGLLLWSGGPKELNALGFVFWGGANSFVLTAIPLFMLMAEILIVSNISAKLYKGLSRLTRRWPGGLLHTNIAGCAVFSAVCGSSVATAAAITRVALPEIRALGYDMRQTCGSLAAGGTLGILIPPSGAMIIYGVLTDTSIARLFSAGILPGIILAGLFMAYIAATSRRGTASLSAGAGRLIGDVLLLAPFAALIFVVIGSIYLGWATPTEAAAIGVVAAGVIGAAVGDLTLAGLWIALRSTVRVSGALLIIIVMAQTLSYALSISGIATGLAGFVVGLGLERTEFLIVLVVLYAVLGCLMDGVAMTMITVPVLFPVVQALGIDPVFFGVILVVMMEFGLITPPFGLNLFVIQQISGEPMSTILKGIVPYCAIILALVGLLMMFPAIVLAL